MSFIIKKEEVLQKYIASYTALCPGLTEEELQFIYNNLSISEYEKKDFFLNYREIQREMGYVYRGLLRSYYIDKKGKRITISFINENSYAADYPSFLQQKPSKYYIECIEPTIIVKLPYLKIQEAYKRYKGFEKYGRLIAEQILIQKQDRIESFLFEDAEERYKRFMNKNSHLVNRISLSHLSSYLGIERQSLSRIRKKMADR